MSAVPPAFTPQTSFSTLAQQPISSTGLPGSELDGEFARASDSINQIKDRLSEVQRDDGKLRNGVVSTESLSADVVDLIALGGTAPITWAAGIQIKVGDLVSNPPGTQGTYLCIIAHTSSSVFANDLANWALIAAPPVVGVLYTNTFTGNGATTAFTLTQIPASKDNTQLYIDGVYQPKSGYSVNGAILTITPAPASGSDIEVSIGVPSDTNIVTVADGSISTAKLANLSVATAKVADSAITNLKIADGSISTTKVVDSSIATAKIANSAVTNAKIAQLSVTSDKIADDSVSTSKLAALSVVADKIANSAISTAKIADNAITTAKISDLSITAAKIPDGTIVEAKIASNAIATAKIADSAVTTSKIATAAITTDKIAQPYTLGTAQATTSGTSIDFTGIPSWAKRITVLFSGFSTNGTSLPIIQVGAGSITTSGYLGAASRHRVDSTNANFTDGFGLTGTIAATSVIHGIMTINKITGNTWVASFSGGASDDTHAYSGGGSIVLSGSLNRIRLTTQGGVNTFDAGSINISYE